MARLRERLVWRLPRRRSDPELERYLLDGERLVFAKRMHPFAVAEPVLTGLAVPLAVVWLVTHLSASAARLHLGDALIVVAVLAFGRGVWRFSEWAWRDRLIMTHKRIMFVHGWWFREVPMMPLAKVTDMTFRRSIPARIFGWGTFVVESAGQDQALHNITWVPDPERTYRQICAEVFKVDDHARVVDDGPSGGPAGGGYGGPAGGYGGSAGGQGGPPRRPDAAPARDGWTQPQPIAVPEAAPPRRPGRHRPRRDDGPQNRPADGGRGLDSGSASRRPPLREPTQIGPGQTLYTTATRPPAEETQPVPIAAPNEWWV